MRPSPFDIYGDYADGYCDAVPASTQPTFWHANGSVAFSRMPGYPEYTLNWEQAVDKKGGGETVGYVPFVQELLVKISWPRMPFTDKVALENFWRNVVKGSSQVFTYNNPLLGPPLPVRFADATLPEMPEVAYRQHQVTLTLRVALNYPQMTISGVPDPSITGNRFSIGSVVVPFPIPAKSGTGYSSSKIQPASHDSSGDLVIYDKSRIIQLAHKLTIMHEWDVFVNFLSFFFTFVHGARNKFCWVDQDGTSRTVRLYGAVSIRQQNYNRFQTQLNLIEEIPE